MNDRPGGDHRDGGRVTQVFLRASEFRDPVARAAFLDEACGVDSGLRAEIEELLRSDLSSRALEGVVPLSSIPDMIGPYRILQILGEGGMGIVYVAEQTTPVKRRVALKVIKHGIDTKQVMARFEAERQALALMNHPNVSRVLDSGSDASGRPYFVMELIKGIPITEYCDRSNLGTRDRLELLIQVCEGVQHAHQKGVIHRDLKPTNILVEVWDGKPVPKIIDFGVAKAIDRQLTERTLFTEFGQVVGTPEYMSPEQAELTGLDVDTRTDVYSLGVLLYELLVGALPFDPRELREAGFDEMRRRIREVTPPMPSARLHTLGARSNEVARQRASDPATLGRLCRGDLDWITMRAIEKDRARRYASASELAADLSRHLRSEPVIAGPPGVGYHARKFLRRHRVGTAFAAALVLAMLGGLVGTTWALRRATLEAATAKEVSEFMFKVFETSDPGGRQLSVRDVLDRGAQRVRMDLADRPELQARVMEFLGTIYRSLGFYDAAQPLLEDAVAAQTRIHGLESHEAARVRTTLGGLLIKSGHPADAIPILENALAVQERALGPDDLELARTLSNLGNSYRSLGDYDRALPSLERALAIREKALGPDHPDVAKTLANLGAVRSRLNDYPGARRDLERALAIYKISYGDDHMTLAPVLNNLADMYRKAGALVEARSAEERAIAIQEKSLGAEHPDLVNSFGTLGKILRDLGDLAGSEAALRRARSIAVSKLDATHPDRERNAAELATTLEAEGKTAEAAALTDEANGKR